MNSTTFDARYSTSSLLCAECGALHGSSAERRIIISYCGDSHRVMMAQGLARRLCLAYGLKLQASPGSEQLWNTRAIQSSLVISGDVGSTWLSTKGGSPLQNMMRNRAAELGALLDVAGWNFGANTATPSPIISPNTYAEFCGNIGNGGRHYHAGRNPGRVWGLWHAHLVPFPHFCQWKRLPVYLRMWSQMWTENTEQLPLNLPLNLPRKFA